MINPYFLNDFMLLFVLSNCRSDINNSYVFFTGS